MLIGWSVALAYLLRFSATPFFKRSVRDFGARVAALLNTHPKVEIRSEVILPKPAFAEVPVPEPVYIPAPQPALSHDEIDQMIPRSYSSFDGFKSFAHGDVLSIDDIVKGLSREQAVSAAATAPVVPQEQGVEPAARPLLATVEEATTAPATAENESAPMNTHDLTAALIAGDRLAVFAGLRDHVKNGGKPEHLVSSVACLLDDTYRSRIEGSMCDEKLSRLSARFDTPTLEKLVTSLATAIDASYTDTLTGAKLALTRALGVIGA